MKYNKKVEGRVRNKSKIGSVQLHFQNKGGAGQAALSLVLLVGGTVVLITATLLFLILSFINSTFGFQAANQAWGLAISGANDALLQLSRTPTMDGLIYDFMVDNYSIDVEIQRSCTWAGGNDACYITQYDDENGLPVFPVIKKPNQALINSSVLVAGRASVLTVFVSLSPEGQVSVIEVKYRVLPASGAT